MPEPTTTYDYTAQLTAINNTLLLIRDEFIAHNNTLTEIKVIKEEMKNIHDNIKDIQDEYLTRAKTQNQGIYTRAVLDPSDLGRAATVVSLKESGTFDDVVSEMQSPTPIP